jgi:hypothetical protein
MDPEHDEKTKHITRRVGVTSLFILSVLSSLRYRIAYENETQKYNPVTKNCDIEV